MAGLDKTGSDGISVIILNTVLADNKMVGSFLGHDSKVSTKFFYTRSPTHSPTFFDVEFEISEECLQDRKGTISGYFPSSNFPKI